MANGETKTEMRHCGTLDPGMQTMRSDNYLIYVELPNDKYAVWDPSK